MRVPREERPRRTAPHPALSPSARTGVLPDALWATFSPREKGNPCLLPLELLAQDLEPEPLVLGAGQRVAQFSVSPGRVGESGRLAGGEVGVGELRLERLEIGAELFDSRRQRLERPAAR